MSPGLAIPVPPELIEAVAARVLDRLEAEPRFISKQKLAHRLGISERTIKTWRSRGLPAAKVGRELMFNVDEVDRWIEEQA